MEKNTKIPSARPEEPRDSSKGSGDIDREGEGRLSPEVTEERQTAEPLRPEPKLWTRRNVIFAVLTGVVGSVIGGVVLKAIEDLARRSTETKVGERVLDLLFRGIDRFDLILAADHPTTPPNYKGTYTNEWEAKLAIRDALPEAVLATATTPYPSEHQHSEVCVGSSISNLRTKQVLGDPRSPRFKYGKRIEFPWSIKVLPNTRADRLQNGTPRTTPNYAVVDRKGNYIAVPECDEHYKLRDDVLLVTRLPRQIGGPTTLIFAGLHGPAVRAVRNLLFTIERRDLDRLETDLGGQRFFQALFRVRDLRESRDTTLPGGIEYERSLPISI